MNTHCIYSLNDFLGQVITEKCWTAWRTEERKNKTTGEVKITKVPYQTVTSESRSNDPTTWISIEDAEAVAATAGFINGGIGGVGLWLGIDYGTEYRVGGVDLDSCLSPNLSPWAKEIIDRFDTYGEISPSRTGIKLYFLYRVADLDAIRLTTGTPWSKNFKERTGSDHAPGFELHIGHRYFAMTGDLYEGCPAALRVVGVEDVAWLINEVGQRFANPQKPSSTKGETASPNDECTTNHADNSRSARAMRKLASLYHQGVIDTYEEGKARLLRDDDSGIADWMREKGVPNGERELRRIWKKIIKSPRDWDRIRRELAEGSEIDADKPVAEEPQTEQDAAEWFDNLTLIDPWDAITSPPKFTRDMAPASLVNYAVDVAARLGNNPEYVLSAMLAACAGVIDDEIVVQPDELDTRWTESARLWICGVGHSGVGKTPAKNAAMQPIKGVEAAWKQQDDIRHRQWLLDREIYENEYSAWEKAVRDGGTDLPPIEPEEPKYRQIIVDDMTMESLGQDVLADNPRGVLMVYDEMMALIGSLDAYNRGHKDRPLLLDLWNGGPKTINRRGTGRITVRNWGASLFGGIQEDKLAKIAHTLDDDGLLQRFLIVRACNAARVSKVPDDDAYQAYVEIINTLASLQPSDFGEPVVLSPEAQHYRHEVEEVAIGLLRDNELLPGALRQHANKINGLFARLLLVLHLVESVFPVIRWDHMAMVSGETAKMARDLMIEMFIPQAVALYMRFFSEDSDLRTEAQWFAGHLLAHPENTHRARDLKRVSHRDTKQVKTAMDMLAAMGWVREVDTNRHDASAWEINPRVHIEFAERAAWEKAERKRKGAQAAKAGRIREKTYRRASKN
jgi:hypothetical protein